MSLSFLTLFSLTEDEYKLAVEFKNSHHCDHINVGAIGGSTTYRFTPTSLGIIAVVSCVCGKELDLTDYESW